MTTATPSYDTASPRPHRAGPPPLRIAVIAASVRKERLSRTLADWAAGRASGSGVDVDLIDLAECDLPDDRELQPGGGPRSVIADRIERADGYVIVTPEYNHSYPAGLKRAVDWHYGEWMFKAATVISYGVQGGLLAAEHLRGVFAELHVVTTRRVVGLREPWNDVHDGGFAPPPGPGEAVDEALRELAWWAETLRAARRDRPFRR
ncbi:NADPH-dependent FMN reductase [Streptosporangium sp. DT93]|uniref:NADPH-dependent FMN reductase n=1 Tax=Streptosporangium sp. DT93 TaxID=3393428 RepID=UPI003CEB4E66